MGTLALDALAPQNAALVPATITQEITKNQQQQLQTVQLVGKKDTQPDILIVSFGKKKKREPKSKWLA